MKKVWLLFLVLFPTFVFGGDIKKNFPSYYQDIRPMLVDKCLGCHANDGVAFSLEDPEVAYSYRAAISSAVLEKRMPPWLAEDGYQEYRDDISLSDDQILLFESWARSGYPKGMIDKLDIKHVGKSENVVFDLTLDAVEEGYLPKQNVKDDYHCFLLDWPVEKDQFMTGFKASPGNTRIIHHIVIFQVQPEIVEMMKDVDKKDPGKGYGCSTGLVADYLADENEHKKFNDKYPDGIKKIFQNTAWLAHWAPGSNQYSLPEGTGVLLKKGSALVVQMHYYSAFAPGERDTGTTISFSLEDEVTKPALYIALTRTEWLSSKQNQTMVIPPKSERTFELSAPLRALANYVSLMLEVKPEDVEGLELLSSNIHMHSYGAAAKSELVNDNGEREVLLSIPRWDIGWQRDFTYKEGKYFKQSSFDNVKYSVECTYKNYGENAVFGGFGSDDEMCYDFVYVAVDLDERPKSIFKFWE